MLRDDINVLLSKNNSTTAELLMGGDINGIIINDTLYNIIVIDYNVDSIISIDHQTVEYKIVTPTYTHLICSGVLIGSYNNCNNTTTLVNTITQWYDIPKPVTKEELDNEIDTKYYNKELGNLMMVWRRINHVFPNRINDIKKALNI